MGRWIAVVLVVTGATVTAEAQPDACAGVDCGHGECMLEGREPFCFCEDGYAADGLRCSLAPTPPVDPRAARSSSVGARIVSIASAEGGRMLHAVGRDLAEYPGRLSQYVKPGGLWCTDFVSWVFRAAGAPFSGGYQGGWHLTNNYAVRRWFQRSSRWVANGSPEWERFTPRPGDYLRFHTDRYGHSAIVRYVAGETLYTVEGNSRGEVRLRHYYHWRLNQRIDGFGIVTQVEPRVAQLRRGSTQDEGAGGGLDEEADERSRERARP
ncbi:MAG: CHAP domain-containing protein [Myxococcales bacterium]|nr:CHAP domain-containing protein [Myxococcales bacterium]